MRLGQANAFPRDVTFEQALHHPEARAIYIDRECHFVYYAIMLIEFSDLQLLQVWTDAFLQATIASTRRLPYGIRYLARETLLHLKVRIRLLNDSCLANRANCLSRGFLMHLRLFARLASAD